MNKRKKVFQVGFNGIKFYVKDYTICNSILSKTRGLMFRSKNYKKPLLFVWKKPVKISIHSFFVFQEFVAVWMLKGKIIEKKLVKPWRIAVTPRGKFDRLLEIPVHSSEMRKI